MNETALGAYVWVLMLLATHFIADFLLQSHDMSVNKSKSNSVLAQHCIVYGLCFIWLGTRYAVITAILHFMVDWCSSRITSRLYARQEYHWFFVVIGADQLIHYIILILTLIARGLFSP